MVAFSKQLLKTECNTSLNISIFCLINLVGISESCEAFSRFKIFISSLISVFVTLMNEGKSVIKKSISDTVKPPHSGRPL